jgi:hypothetical protein
MMAFLIWIISLAALGLTYHLIKKHKGESTFTGILAFVVMVWLFCGKGVLDYALQPVATPAPASQTQELPMYPANAHTMIFHKENCKYVEKISDKNYEVFFDRKEAVQAGYRPCKVCNP